MLSEEGSEDPRRFTADRVWIVDPLDGTNEFGEIGRSDWAVHVALWEHGRLSRCGGQPAGPRHHLRQRSPAADARAHAAAPTDHHLAQPCAVRCGAGGERARVRRRATRIGRGEGDGRRARRSRHLRARWRDVPVGLGRAGRRRPGGGAARDRESTDRRSSTTSATRGCPTCSSAAPNWPSPHSMRSGASVARRGRERSARPARSDRGAVRGRRRTSRRSGCTVPIGTTPGPVGCTASTAPCSPTSTRSPTCGPWWSPALPRRSASAATARRSPATPSVARTTRGLGGDVPLARPGYGVRPEFDHDFAFQFAHALPDHRRGQRCCGRRGAGAGAVLRPAVRQCPGALHHGSAEAGPARRVRHELDACRDSSA